MSEVVHVLRCVGGCYPPARTFKCTLELQVVENLVDCFERFSLVCLYLIMQKYETRFFKKKNRRNKRLEKKKHSERDAEDNVTSKFLEPFIVPFSSRSC